MLYSYKTEEIIILSEYLLMVTSDFYLLCASLFFGGFVDTALTQVMMSRVIGFMKMNQVEHVELRGSFRGGNKKTPQNWRENCLTQSLKVS